MSTLQVTFAEAVAALRAKRRATTNPAYQRELDAWISAIEELAFHVLAARHDTEVVDRVDYVELLCAGCGSRVSIARDTLVAAARDWRPRCAACVPTSTPVEAPADVAETEAAERREHIGRPVPEGGALHGGGGQQDERGGPDPAAASSPGIDPSPEQLLRLRNIVLGGDTRPFPLDSHDADMLVTACDALADQYRETARTELPPEGVDDAQADSAVLAEIDVLRERLRVHAGFPPRSDP